MTGVGTRESPSLALGLARGTPIGIAPDDGQRPESSPCPDGREGHRDEKVKLELPFEAALRALLSSEPESLEPSGPRA